MDILTLQQALKQQAQEAELWAAENGVTYARFILGDQRVTYSIQSQTFRMWLTNRVLAAGFPLPPSRALSLVLSDLEHEANSTSDRYPVCRRIHNDEDATYFNLGADQVLIVSADGCEIASDHGLIFPTDPTMMPLPAPVDGGDVLKVLSALLDLDEQQTLLVLSYLMAYFQPDGRFPPLIVTGPPKSGKSRLAASIRQMFDPAHAPLLEFPGKLGDFNAIAASNSVLAFDNVTNVPQTFRDAIMALAEGTARFDRRSGTISKNKKATILVCEDLSNVGEVARDAIVIRLQGRGIGKMKSKNILDREFSAIHATAFGALADLAAKAKALDDTVELNASFKDGALELWLLCVDKALGANGKLMEAYRQNGRTVLSDIVSESPVLSAFMSMLRTKGSVTATAMDMQGLVEPFLAGSEGACWPKSPKDFATLLRKSAYAMPDVEIEFNVRTGKERDRMIVASLKLPERNEIEPTPAAVRPVKVRKKPSEADEQPRLI